MIPDWKCCICGKDADYAQGRRKYCQEHWNYGEPAKPTLKEVTSVHEDTGATIIHEMGQ